MENFFIEKCNHEGWLQGIKIEQKLFSTQSEFQKIDVYNTQEFGRLLTLDDKTMFTEADEFVYHETMAHVAMMAHPGAKRVLIIGGGDAGIVTQLVRYPQLDEIHLVEIDKQVIETSQKFFPKIAIGLNDQRVQVLATDGIKFVEDKTNYYDIILVDSTDPEGFALGLFSKTYYQNCFNSLTEQGILMCQSENPFFTEYDLTKIFTNLKSCFPIVKAVTAPMLAYPGVFWTFGVASKKLNPSDINSKYRSFNASFEKNNQWYNQEWHKGAFALPNFVKNRFGLN